MALVRGITKKGMTQRRHKTSTYYVNGSKKTTNYTVVIPHIQGQIGLGDGLNTIMLEYSDANMFGKPILDSQDGPKPDSRPQAIIANMSNHNNILPYVQNPDDCTECYEGTIFRKNINLQRLARKHVFWHSCKIIQDDLFLSLLVRRDMADGSQNTTLFGYLPTEIIEIIIQQIYYIGLFNTHGIEYVSNFDDFCCKQ